MRKANCALHLEKVKAEQEAKGLKEQLKGHKAKSEEVQANALSRMRDRFKCSDYCIHKP